MIGCPFDAFGAKHWTYLVALACLWTGAVWVGRSLLGPAQRRQADLLTRLNRLDLQRQEFDRDLESGIQAMEMAFRMLEGTLIGITGSNGKSTTTALTGELLRASGFEVEVLAEAEIGAALLHEFNAVRNVETRAALAVALGMCGYREATDGCQIRLGLPAAKRAFPQGEGGFQLAFH